LIGKANLAFLQASIRANVQAALGCRFIWANPNAGADAMIPDNWRQRWLVGWLPRHHPTEVARGPASPSSPWVEKSKTGNADALNTEQQHCIGERRSSAHDGGGALINPVKKYAASLLRGTQI
jgi:hypothetical protein